MSKHFGRQLLIVTVLILLASGINNAYANTAPSITAQPVNTTVTATLTAKFTVAAIGAPTPTYQWQSEASGATSFIAISGATASSYTTPATTTAMSGTKYECVVTNVAGNVTSSAVTLTVNPTVAPSITTQPVNTTVTATLTAKFTIVATGAPTPTYQWQSEASGATSFIAISGATASSYTTPATTTAMSGTKYECVVANVAGSVTSSAVTLTVNPTVVPSITTQPVNTTVTATLTAKFSLIATGAPTPTYQWQSEAPGAASFTAISGATTATYTTLATTTAMSGTKYECVVTNVVGSVTSSSVTLTVNPTVAPSITTQPVNTTVTATLTAKFTIVATGAPTPTYQWQSEASGATSFTAISGATASSYTTPATTTAMSGTKYECVVTNVAGNVTSSVVTLTVNPTVAPSITTQPVNTTVTATLTAKFTIVATGAPTPTYQWQSEASGATSFIAISGATASSYTILATTTAMSGTKYECVVANVAGSVTSSAVTLTVNPTVVPSITTQPVNTTVTATLTAKFSLIATGAPTPTYQWQSEAPGAASFTAISGATTATYTTLATTTAMSGTKYECVVTNVVGSVTSSSVTLTVNPTVAPSITTQPVNTTVTAPATATFRVVATGTPTPTYQWQSEASGATTYTAISGATATSYTTPATTTANSGTKYECVVTNSAGSVTSSAATLTVISSSSPVVSITSPANNSTLTAGVSMTITASASEAGGSISSVSFYNGETLLGTSTASPYSYTITNALVGIYTLTATAKDANGVAATSSLVTVTVTGQPSVSIASPANQGTYTTGTIGITAIATENYGTISSVAFYNGTTLLGTITSTSQAFTYSWVNVSAGTYTIKAVATDILGTTASSTPITFTIESASSTTAVDDNVASITDALDHTTSFQYDNDNRLLKITFADGSTVSEAFDLFGNQTSVTDQRGNTLTKTYDAYERLSQTKDPLGGIAKFSYDTNGDLLTLTDANGHATSYTYDADYRVLTQKNALGFTAAYTYDPVGNVASRTDANSKTTNYAYDGLNRLTSITYPDTTSVVNYYDALGRRTSMSDSTGSTAYSYDALSRLLSKASPGTNNTITYTYDSEGNLLTTIDQNNRTITNTYDALDRLATVADPNGTSSYGYDADSDNNLVKTPNGVTQSYTFDALNRILTDVNATSSGVISSFTNVYDIAGMITKKTLQDGSWTAYSYDALNRLLTEEKQTSAAIDYDYVYTYDLVGNRLTWTKDTTLGGFWSVDSLNMPPQVLTNMTSAGYGSTASPTQAVDLARSYSYDTGNRLTAWNYAANINSSSFPIQTDSYTYDDNGNRLTKQAVLTGETSTPQQTTYSYDFENRLNQLQYTNIPNITGTQTDSFAYNGEWLRTQAVLNSVASNYLYDGFNILNERNGSGTTTKSYTRGLDFGGGIGSLINQTSSGTTQYYQYNDLGSTANLTTSTGTTAQSYAYDAYGNLLAPQASGDTNRYLFSTKEIDSRSGLQYFGYRYYDPEIGRWLTPDPLGMIRPNDILNFYVNSGNPVTITPFTNLYAYSGDNPVNFLDPYGLKSYWSTIVKTAIQVLLWANSYWSYPDDWTGQAGTPGQGDPNGTTCEDVQECNKTPEPPEKDKWPHPNTHPYSAGPDNPSNPNNSGKERLPILDPNQVTPVLPPLPPIVGPLPSSFNVSPFSTSAGNMPTPNSEGNPPTLAMMEEYDESYQHSKSMIVRNKEDKKRESLVLREWHILDKYF